jgi:DHA1 family bicyclomycin/chloramphenicol resistance-like MFS transporter
MEKIYELNSPSQKSWALAAGALVALITPFTDTVYLPALSSVQIDLHASADDIAATVSAYLAAVGVGQVLWGPLSDRCGRLPVLYGAMLAFLLLTAGCVVAPDINSLIILRTFEGFVVGVTIVSVPAIIADMYAPEERGD